MKLTEKIKSQAEETYNVNEIGHLPFFVQKIAQAMVNEHGFYSCLFNDKKVLIVK